MNVGTVNKRQKRTYQSQSETVHNDTVQDNDTSSEENDIGDEHGSESVDENTPGQNRLEIDATLPSDGRYHNKQRCLILCSRGVTSRHRHLLEDLRTLIPHHKKDSKLDAGKASKGALGGIGRAVNEIAEIRGANTVLFLESKKRQDAYLWMGHTGNSSSSSMRTGPSAKFLVENIHTMDELRLTGNCMKGSRPILNFESTFDKIEHLKLLKYLFTDIFGTPRGHPKSKPFVDRVMGFYYVDGKIWVRNYQIIDQQPIESKEIKKRKDITSLVEIGPRLVLNVIRIFRGSFGGQTLYKNDDFVAPNFIRSMNMQDKGKLYQERKNKQRERRERQENIVLPEDPLNSVFQ
mmetsp:Transcript_8567/g.12218  ORF Transcript_8567/g.12218 Transcript_8567/m.12218 type:complete len:349 (-) Transcript_8567:235-1281(-)